MLNTIREFLDEKSELSSTVSTYLPTCQVAAWTSHPMYSDKIE